ncbi:hypothetical protein [Janthinobacterium sp.]|uniref:hypothetical protein n=1 Tax=Janthinobacterium sp. TaxID=1871054 RepID=UPI0026271A60|nr:hypothetical protein [Janthinobacterium sp.]
MYNDWNEPSVAVAVRAAAGGIAQRLIGSFGQLKPRLLLNSGACSSKNLFSAQSRSPLSEVILSVQKVSIWRGYINSAKTLQDVPYRTICHSNGIILND